MKNWFQSYSVTEDWDDQLLEKFLNVKVITLNIVSTQWLITGASVM